MHGSARQVARRSHVRVYCSIQASPTAPLEVSLLPSPAGARPAVLSERRPTPCSHPGGVEHAAHCSCWLHLHSAAHLLRRLPPTHTRAAAPACVTGKPAWPATLRVHDAIGTCRSVLRHWVEQVLLDQLAAVKVGADDGTLQVGSLLDGEGREPAGQPHSNWRPSSVTRGKDLQGSRAAWADNFERTRR
jgi:hypothetical protein